MTDFEYAHSISVIETDDLLVEATLYKDSTIELMVEVREDGRPGRLELDEARKLAATLGHLIWVAENEQA